MQRLEVSGAVRRLIYAAVRLPLVTQIMSHSLSCIICTVLQRIAQLKCAHDSRCFIRPAVLLNTGCRGRVRGTPASYTGGPSFKSRHKSQLPDWYFSFLSSASSWNVHVSTPSSETTTSLHVRRSSSLLVLQFHCICSLYAKIRFFFRLANIPVFIFISHT